MTVCLDFHRDFIQADIVSPWGSAHFRLDLLNAVPVNKPADLAGGIVQISENPGRSRTGLDTSRLASIFHAMRAPVALLDDRQIGVKIAHAVGTGSHTVAATDAFVRIHFHDSAGLLIARQHRAHGYTDRFVAVVAQDREEGFARVGKYSFGNQLDPGTIAPHRDVPLLLACDRTALAADAPSEIYQKSKSFLPVHS